MEEILSARGLTKRFGNRTVLDGLDLTLKSGRIYGLIGPNGAGKTTLLRLTAGLCLPTEGSLILFGGESERALRAARRRVGFLIEEPIASESRSVGRNLSMQAALAGQRDRERIRALRKSLGITERKVGMGSYALCSTGQKQRYGVAAALLGEPELLVLDEPMNGLDTEGSRDLRELLLRLNREKGVTMLISSHDLETLRLLATDYIFLIGGRLRQTLPAEELERRLEAEGMKRLEDYFFRLREDCGEDEKEWE
jgi:ABC-2 type transport system ATP-binding protein